MTSDSTLTISYHQFTAHFVSGLHKNIQLGCVDCELVLLLVVKNSACTLAL